jgi:hypothetical protein
MVFSGYQIVGTVLAWGFFWEKSARLDIPNVSEGKWTRD